MYSASESRTPVAATSEKLLSIPSIPVLALKRADDGISSTSAATPTPTSCTGSQAPSARASANHLTGQRMTSSYSAVTAASEDELAELDEVWTPSAAPVFHQSIENCTCPMCRLMFYISYVYRDQRRASPHVIQARPSPEFMLAADGTLPPLPVLNKPIHVEVCPVFAAYGFCPFHRACLLPHVEETARTAAVSRLDTIEAELDRLIERAEKLRRADVWTCEVCNYDRIDERCEAALGTEHFFRQCPRCTFTCYFPHITYLIEKILASVGDDYQLYKTEVDRCRGLLPDIFKIPVTFEAHRVANVVFAWSLVSPAHVRDAMETVVREFPEVASLVSIGSGAGYIEHVFNRVLHAVPLQEEWEADRLRFPASSFDGVHCSFYGQRVIPIYAFDALSLRETYSAHVSMGGPVALYSMDCATAVLLLCWPPFGSRDHDESSMGFEALEYFTQQGGQMLIYIGDTAATGDWRFHMLLRSHYKLIRDYPVRRELRRWCPQEMGFVYGGNDTIGVYRLRGTPLRNA